MNKQEIINYFMEKGVLIGPDFFDKLQNGFNESDFFNLLNEKTNDKPLVLNKDLLSSVSTGNQELDFNWVEFDSARVSYEKEGQNLAYDKFLEISNKNIESLQIQENKQEEIKENLDDSRVKVLLSYEYKNKKKEVAFFI